MPSPSTHSGDARFLHLLDQEGEFGKTGRATLAALARSELSLIRMAYGPTPPLAPNAWPPRIEAAWHLAKGVQRLLAERPDA
jgi:hypothetical protein